MRPLRLTLACCLLAACGAATPLYPARPPSTEGAPIADPTPGRIVIHATVTGEGMAAALNANVPAHGEGKLPVAGSERPYTYDRQPFKVSFRQGRVGLAVHVDVRIDLPVSHIDLPLDLEVLAEPVVTSRYVAKLQSVDVKVASSSTALRVAEAVGGALDKVKSEMQKKIEESSFDLRPTLEEGYLRAAKPVALPLGDANGCASLNVLGVEAGPTVLADGIEKDFALVVAPSVTLPCGAPATPPPLPLLANVATIQPGPFTLTVPVAARYEELQKAMALAFTDGKLFFNKDFPDLYMEAPEVFASDDKLILKVHIAGSVHKLGDHALDGDLYLAGHPAVVDNELSVPDLEPTIETASFLLKLKATFDAASMRDAAKKALRLDIGERLKAVREKLSTDLSFADGNGCVQAGVSRIEVTGVHPHGTYLRVYVTATAQAAAYVPCPTPP